MKFDYIFFDSGGTLYQDSPKKSPTARDVARDSAKRVQAWLAVMGHHFSEEQVREAITAGAKMAPISHGKDHNFHHIFIEVIKLLGIPLGAEEAACLADVFAGPRYAFWLFPGTLETLQKLKDGGYSLGIIANTAWPGFSMDRAFTGVGLLPLFEARVYSGDVGVSKPDPAIFDIAARLAKLKHSKRILYVGNDPKKDVAAAANVGWTTALRLTEDGVPTGLADFEFHHSAELLDFCL